jgi:NAD(P)-dependent dehydrogenase (short-subunit alcohol dehydrogenase family)
VNKTVVVTGAGAGVGRAIARAFAERGCNVGLLSRDAERLRDSVSEIEARGMKACAVPTDVADHHAVEAAADTIERELGPIGVWVNDAMVTIFAPVHEILPEDFKRATEVTYLGTVNGTMAALRRMRERRSGAIIQVGSALAYRAIPLQAAYCGAKFAIRGFTDSLRCELMHDKMPITLTMVQLPGMNTPQFDWAMNKMPEKAQPVPPIYQPEVAAEAVVFAAFHKRREIWVGASSWQVILGNTVAPWLLDWYLAEEGYCGQMRKVPNSGGEPGNLFHPVSGHQAAHGSFDDQAKPSTATLWYTKNRDAIFAGAAALVGAYVLGVLPGRR